jgi:hypothetical protein
MKEKKLNGDTPATQADLATWGGELTRRLDGLAEAVAAIKNNMATKDDLAAIREDLEQYATKHDLHDFKTEIIQHFDAAAARVSEKETSARQKADEHLRRRVRVLEAHLGLPPSEANA